MNQKQFRFYGQLFFAVMTILIGVKFINSKKHLYLQGLIVILYIRHRDGKVLDVKLVRAIPKSDNFSNFL